MSQWDVPGLFGGKSTESLKPWETDSVKAPGNGTQAVLCRKTTEHNHGEAKWALNRVCECVCVWCVCVCGLYVCVHACVGACASAFLYVSVWMCRDVDVDTCVPACIYVCVCTCICVLNLCVD